MGDTEDTSNTEVFQRGSGDSTSESKDINPASSFPNISHKKHSSFIIDTNTQDVSERIYKRKTYWKNEYSGLVTPNEVCCERYLHYLWDEKRLEQHVARIVHAKPKIDNKPPLLIARSFFNSQGLNETERRMKARQQQNLALVQKIGVATSSKRRNRVDCWNQLELHRHDWPERKTRLTKIKRDNAVLLERIMSVPPTKDSHREHLLSDWDRHVQVRQNMRKYPKLPTITVPKAGGDGDNANIRLSQRPSNSNNQ